MTGTKLIAVPAKPPRPYVWPSATTTGSAAPPRPPSSIHSYCAKGFTQSRWDALLRYWGAVCRHGPCGPISSLHPWENWVPPDLHCFLKWVFDSLEVLNGFLRQVVVSRRDVGIRKWTRWLREDFSSRPYVWLRPYFVPASPFLVVNDPQTPSSRILVEPHLIDAEFRKAWMLFSVGLVILSSLLINFLVLLVIFCLRSLIWIFLGLRDAICRRWLVLKIYCWWSGWMGLE